MTPFRGFPALVLVATLGPAACVTPTDRSDEIRVEVDPIPSLLLKDSMELVARVLDASGAAVPNAIVSFASSDQTVISIDTSGFLRAVGVGTATVTVSAIAFADAEQFTQETRVRGLLEVDSIRPANVRFGEVLNIYGVGLDTNALFSITFTGFNEQDVDAPVSEFVPVDPDRPEGEARLSIWVPPPAERRSVLTLLGFNGGLIVPDTIQVVQRDLYEPNDTVPAALGPIPDGFFNPALAFEPRQRNEGVAADVNPADWFTFENTTAQDRTLIFFSENAGAQSFGIFVTDSLAWIGSIQSYIIGRDSWAIGPESYFCNRLEFSQNGEPVQISEVLFPLSIIALKDLPAGTFHILAPYEPQGTPASYELLVASSYLSVLPADPAEENDYCDVATPVAQTGTVNLTIDNPHDIDWFRFTVTGTPQPFTFTATATTVAPSFADEEPDIDLYLVRDFRPDSLVVVDVGALSGASETVSAVLPAGDYFLVVFDFVGVPTRYTLTSATGVGVPTSVALSRQHTLTERLETLAGKRAAAPRVPHLPAWFRPERLR